MALDGQLINIDDQLININLPFVVLVNDGKKSVSSIMVHLIVIQMTPNEEGKTNMLSDYY